MFTIRPYQPTDKAAWLDCRALAYQHSQFIDQIAATRETYSPEADGYAHTVQLVAIRDQQLVGLIDAGVFTPERSAHDLYVADRGCGSYIEVFAVAPTAQNQGIGRALLNACCAQLQQLGADYCEIFTRSDPAANRLYQALGAREIAHSWRVLGTRRDAPIPAQHWQLDPDTQELTVTVAGQAVGYRAEQPQWFTVFNEPALADFNAEAAYVERTYLLNL
ncbi:GNAT family N-acetyltransferase [Lacticaseibacillus daqingensis]|uniref:GNAT family N-acetyltransferase n=1 Tax=Lacticaseibacillus daqingensis TaxID=2486014 RepID=UPI000F7967C9|nr:N-acetyltransferase [Lacticaseibacillus daqingensis]